MGTREFYRMYDPNPTAAIKTPREKLEYWNDQYFGIFRTIHEFNGPRRNANVVRLRGWPFDIDHGTKPEMLERIKNLPILPTIVVETKRGFQGLFKSEDATKDNYKLITRDIIAQALSSDSGISDFARMYRVPGFFHCKNPGDKFLVKEICNNGAVYSEAQMLRFLPTPKVKIKKIENISKTFNPSDSFWTKVASLDCEYALDKLSGHPACRGETFSFRPVGDGKLNILVNGKGTGCWIDCNKKIGSLTGGGPTIANWIHWYGRSWGEVKKIVREVFGL